MSEETLENLVARLDERSMAHKDDMEAINRSIILMAEEIKKLSEAVAEFKGRWTVLSIFLTATISLIFSLAFRFFSG